MHSSKMLVGVLRQETGLARCFCEGTGTNVTCCRPSGHAEAASEACAEQVERKICDFFRFCSLKRDLQKDTAAMGSVTLQHKATHAVWLESFTGFTRGQQEGGGGKSRFKSFLLNLIAQEPVALDPACFCRCSVQEYKTP